MSGVVEAQQAEPLAFLARSLPMRNGTACGQTTLCVASFGSQTESVNAAWQTANTIPWVSPYAQPRRKSCGRQQLPRLTS